MNMCWSVRVSVKKLQQFACRSVIGYGIRCRPQAVKGIFAILIGLEFPSEVGIYLVLVLLFIQS